MLEGIPVSCSKDNDLPIVKAVPAWQCIGDATRRPQRWS